MYTPSFPCLLSEKLSYDDTLLTLFGFCNPNWNFLKCIFLPCLTQVMIDYVGLILRFPLCLNLSNFTMMCLSVVFKIFIFLWFIALFECMTLYLLSALADFFQYLFRYCPYPIIHVLFLLKTKCMYLRPYHTVPFISYSLFCIFHPFYSPCFILGIFFLPKF